MILISHNLHDVFEVADNDHRAAPRPERRPSTSARETNQQKVVEAITAGQLSKVPGQEVVT